MAIYNDLETSKKEKREHKLYLNLFYTGAVLLVGFVILVMSGYEVKDIFFRNPQEDLYYFLTYFDGVIEWFLWLGYCLAESFYYMMNSSSLSMDQLLEIFSSNYGINRFEADIPLSIVNKGFILKDGSHVVYVTLAFFALFLYFVGMFFGKKRVWKKYLYIPFSSLFFEQLNEDDKKKFAFSGNWVSEFKDKMFGRYVKKHDGYQRAEFLEYWDTYPDILSGKEHVYEKQYAFIQHLFLTDETFDDLFYIIEGYMTKYEKAPVSSWAALKAEFGFEDVNRKSGHNQPVYFDKFIPLKKEDFVAYRCFNGQDEVTFCPDAITYMIDEETENFIEMIKLRGFKGRSKLSKKVGDFMSYFKKAQKRHIDMLFGANNQKKVILDSAYEKSEYEKLLANPSRENVENRLIFVLSAYFRFILLRNIIGCYMNLPAGTIVVKTDDYTLRMIVDNYAAKSYIQVIAGKNDGTNKEFQSDALANVFIYAYWFYNDLYGTTKLEDRIDYHFNTDVSKIKDAIVDAEMDKAIEEARVKTKNKPSQKKTEEYGKYLEEEKKKQAEKDAERKHKENR